jgi:hypothetical protein
MGEKLGNCQIGKLGNFLRVKTPTVMIPFFAGKI